MNTTFQIAIDGPVSAGKGTVARQVAERLNLLYIDTGAMYRATALAALRNNIDWENANAIVQLLKTTQIELFSPQNEKNDGRLITVIVDEEDVSWEIRTEEMSQGASIVSTHPDVRKALVKQQQAIAQKQDVVMEGRDITSVVLPNANIKIYLDAAQQVRVARRYNDLKSRGVKITFEEVFQEVRIRDNRDMSREADPLQIVEDAWVLDTTELTIDEVVAMIEKKVKKLKKNKLSEK